MRKSNPFAEKSIDDLLDGRGQQPNSQEAYNIDREIERRKVHATAELSQAQILAAKKQILAAEAIVSNAFWIRASAISVVVGTVIGVATFVLSVL